MEEIAWLGPALMGAHRAKEWITLLMTWDSCRERPGGIAGGSAACPWTLGKRLMESAATPCGPESGPDCQTVKP
jgi:hypothetical protein